MIRTRFAKAALFLIIALTGLLASPVSQAEILRLREVDAGKVFRGSNPENYEDLLRLKGMGIRTIINLRNNKDYISWQSSLAEVLGLRVINKPTASLFSPSDRHVDEIQALMKDPALQPVFIHCKHGKDRTGLMVGIYRVETQGWTPEAAYAEMRSLDFNPVLIGLRHYFWERTGDRCENRDDLVPELSEAS